MLLQDLLEVMVVLADSVGEPSRPLPHEQLPLRQRVIVLAEYPRQLLQERFFEFNFKQKRCHLKSHQPGTSPSCPLAGVPMPSSAGTLGCSAGRR